MPLYILGTNATKWVVGKGIFMATVKVALENGFFVSTNDCYEWLVEPTHVMANGWDCVIKEDGTIQCDAVRSYSDGEHSIRYVIQPNGFGKLTLKLPNSRVKTLRKGFVVPRGCKLSDGMIGLAGGHIDNRYAYFRDSSFQKFLERLGITAVKHEDPNQEYMGFCHYSAAGEASQEVFSDGEVSWRYQDAPGSREYFESPGGNPNLYSGTSFQTVKGATWAIVEDRCTVNNSHRYSRILYTKVPNVKELESSLMQVHAIAETAMKMGKVEALKALGGRSVLSLTDITSVIADAQGITPKMALCLDEEALIISMLTSLNGEHFTVEVEQVYDYYVVINLVPVRGESIKLLSGVV